MVNQELIKYLLIKVMEECAEISKESSKCILFGFNDCDPRDHNPTPNIQKLTNEFEDLLGVISLLEESGIILDIKEHKVNAKKDKLRKYFQYHKNQKVKSNYLSL